MGSETLPTLLFIHGLSATAESCYGTVGHLLQNNWHIVLCELDGHYEESPAFTSIDAECEQIEDYFRKKHNGKIHGMIGLSLGGLLRGYGAPQRLLYLAFPDRRRKSP